jgi:hypothetical protein
MRRVMSAALCLVVLSAGAAHAANVTRSNVKDVGNSRFGGGLRRTVFASHSGTSGVIDCDAAVSGKILGRSYRVVTLSRRVEGRALGSGASATRRFQLELFGRGNISIGVSLSRNIDVATFRIPVPVGPFSVQIRGSVGTSLSVRAHIGDAGIVQVGLEGSVAVGGTVGVGVGVPGARVGVEAQLSLLRGALPASCTMRRSGVTFDVAFVISSDVEVKLFAEVGFGPFKKKWTVDVPFLKFTFASRRYPVASLTVRG